MSSSTRNPFRYENVVEDRIGSSSGPARVSPPLKTDRDSITRDKERLQRFHKEAISFLRKAYLDDDTVLVDDTTDRGGSAIPFDDVQSQRRIELDRVRLERFHAQAVSFLDRAYADEPGTIVEEEILSAGAHSANADDRELLAKFHEEAMSFLDAAAGVTPPAVENGNVSGGYRDAPGLNRDADRTSLRIARDKARLEQHYQDAMSFLNRADDEKKTILVEEQELELAVVDRYKLQKYAQDAMVFLDKAFRNDSSVIVHLEDEVDLDGEQAGGSDLLRSGNVFGSARSKEGRLLEAKNTDSTGAGVPSADSPYRPMEQDEELLGARDRGSGNQICEDEDKQIAADRAALERYDEEVGDFLSKAYEDDLTVIVEDADSETSGPDRGLYARRVNLSTTSADTGDTTYSGSAPVDDELSDAEQSYEQVKGVSVAMSSQAEVVTSSLLQEESKGPTLHASSRVSDHESGDEELHSMMMRYEREAANYLDGTNVSVDDDDADSEENEECATPPDFLSNGEQRDAALMLDSHDRDLVGISEQDGLRTGDDTSPVFHRASDTGEATTSSGFGVEGIDDGSRQTALELKAKSSEHDGMVGGLKPGSLLGGSSLRSTQADNFLVDLILEDNTGRSQELSQIPLERSFYRQIPRGSTVKLRPFPSPQLVSGYDENSTSSVNAKKDANLRRVERERDALLAALEEIVNERSMLAVQVSEMKLTMQGAGGMESGVRSVTESCGAIDLAAELRDAHATMANLTEEMEATLGVLDRRYQETLERAHKAEERCIRLELKGSKLEKEFSEQGVRLSRTKLAETRLSGLLIRMEQELDAHKQKAGDEVGRLEKCHKEELERSIGKIIELTDQVSELEQRVQSESRSGVAHVPPQGSKSTEASSARTEQQFNESQNLSTDTGRSATNSGCDTQNAELGQAERQNSIGGLKKLEQLQKESEAAKQELQERKASEAKLAIRVKELERGSEDLRRALQNAARGQVTAEAEARLVRSRYEEALRKRVLGMDQKAEMKEIQAALDHLKLEAGGREHRLLKQLSDFRTRAEQAEVAAAQAERNAKEAAQAAQLAQERSRNAVERERKARRTAEAEIQAISRECKEWEKFAQQQLDLNTTDDSSTSELAKSSSRRGLRSSSSKQGVKEGFRKKRDGKGSGATDDNGRKRSTLRPRLFG